MDQEGNRGDEVNTMVDPYAVIQMPWITEKTLEARRVADGDDRRQQNNNRLEFIVRRESTKPQIKEAVEVLLHGVLDSFLKRQAVLLRKLDPLTDGQQLHHTRVVSRRLDGLALDPGGENRRSSALALHLAPRLQVR